MSIIFSTRACFPLAIFKRKKKKKENQKNKNPPLFYTYQGGRGVAKIGIINAASLDPLGGYQYYRDLFLKYGALEANRIPIDVNHTSANADPKVVSLIRQQTGFFFGGGDQQRVIDT